MEHLFVGSVGVESEQPALAGTKPQEDYPSLLPAADDDEKFLGSVRNHPGKERPVAVAIDDQVHS